ncbi:glycosyltransferase [Urechidicola vernalis]|uniref:Glycosyltransferase n=1 Tax=Urechidicola vernalis TaxID=3075600 RepID=A0ABU2Y3I0_9FLAO|nr:glycosyltransferase [Urechidicola sp. P050]MDT0552257.1 glycosyltransferase [Urechidicola sp. P050]
MKKKVIYIGNNITHKTKYTPQLKTLTDLLKTEGFAIIISSKYLNKFKRVVDMLWTLLKNRSRTSFVIIDTFGTSNFYSAVFISQWARLLGLPYVPVLRGGNLPLKLKENPYFSKLLFLYSYKNIAPSGYLKAALNQYGYSAEVIPNVIDISIYPFKNRKEFQPKILYVRAFHQIYNPTMAVRVLHKVQKKFPKASLCMIGPPMDDSFEQTKQLARELGLVDSIKYTGVLSKSDWHKVSEEYDIFINTTTIDNTPVSVMEAMAMGIPVISTNVGGIPYLLEDGKDAFLVPNNDSVAMADKIVEIVSNQIAIEPVVKNARCKVEQFDWNVVRQAWIKLLNEKPQKKGLVDTLYDSSPLFVQNLLVSAYGIYWKRRRLGGNFKKYLKEFKSREHFSKQQWDEYQTQELRKLLIHAFTTVPFYYELYKGHGFSLEDFERFELKDLNKLPYLEKEDLRKFGKSTLLSQKKEKGTYVASSGSTGTPVSIYLSKRMHQKWNAAYESRLRNWAGVNSSLARGMIGGRRILNPNRPKKPFYRFNRIENQTYFSTYYINEKNTPDYIDGLVKHKVEYLVGYAMSIYFLAENINKLKLDAPKLKGVLTSSEKLTRQMRLEIEKAFQCKVFDAYSGVEACGLISENMDGELLFSPDTGIMEVLDSEGNEVNDGESGEVIATGLLNFDQPLIRYRIGDRVTKAKNQKTKSGIEMPIIESIDGRIEDVVLTNDGRRMVRFHSVFIDINGLVAGQLVQKKIDEIHLNLMVNTQFSTNDESEMEERVQNQLGKVKVYFNYVEEIPKNKNGKIRAVISELSN